MRPTKGSLDAAGYGSNARNAIRIRGLSLAAFLAFLQVNFAEQRVAFIFQDPADYGGSAKGGRLGDLLGANINLTPAKLF